MLSNLKIKKIGACCGILSILFSNIAVAMQPEPGVLAIHGKQSLQIVGQSQPLAIPEDISRLSYEDFDITAHLSEMPFPKGVPVWPREKRKVESWHLDTNIPYIAGANPTIDYDSLRAIPFFIAKYLNDKIHPSKQAGAKDFFEKTIIPNQQTLSSGTQEIPDLDCLYYKAVSGNQHLFLRLSSLTRKEAEIFKQRANGKTLFVESGELKLLSDRSMVLDHVNAEADKITVEAKDTIFNRASKMKAKWIIRLKAGKQRNETVINKWVRESKGKHHFAHAEGVESIDDCSFVAKKVVQEGDEVENYGIFVEADKFEDRATHTLNMPAKITLVNYAWEEDDDMFSSATSSVRQTDDVLVPTRYHVNYYRSASDTEGSSVKFGYTIVNSGSKIEVLKDTKEDVVVDEQHTIEIHEETSGFSICGGISIPDPTSRLQQIRATHKSGNTIGLTAAAIGAVAKGIQAYEDYKVAETLVNHENPWSMEQTTALLQTLSHYVHGPSIQFGNRSVDLTQQTTLTHGNTFVAPTQIFHNSVLSSFAGTYLAENMDIKTKTFITFDLPRTTHSEMTMHQSGISMDLLSFAVSLMNPAVGSALDAALSASSVTIGFQNGESSQTIHKPTILQAGHKLDIEAESGQLTQAQIKAGIVHAVFTKDSVLETLANEKWTRKKGGNLAFGLSGLAEFKTLADVLQNAVTSANISNIDSGSFEKVIDDFASMVGEEEFYLKVGGILKTKSAFLGHATHNPIHEHIEAKERQDIKVEELHEAYDRSFDLSVGDLMTVVSTLKQQIKDEAIAEGMSQDEAELKAEQETAKIKQDITQEQKKVDETAEKIVKIDEKVKAKAKATNKEKSEALIDGLKTLAKEQAELQSKPTENIVEEASMRTQLDALNAVKQKYLTDLARIEKEEKVRHADEVVRSCKEAWCAQNLEDPWFIDTQDVKLPNETEIRRAAEEKTAREFKQKRDTVEAEYRARVRYVQNEGFVDIHSGHVFVGVETPAVALFSEKDLNLDNSRLERLRQEELSKVGESTYQRFVRFIPVVGSAIDYHYDRISDKEFYGSLGIDVASTLALGGMQKAVVGSKAALQAQFNRNLYARFNQAPYNPRTAQNLASDLLGPGEFTRTTVPGQSMPNVRLAGQCKERIVGTDPLTFKPIIQRVVFDQRGFPIFDPYIKVEARISSPNLNLLSRKKHFQMATQNLYQDILSGKIDRNLFSQSEWLDIEHGRPKIGNYTWHHHQETGRMQLIPTDIHQWIGHIGGFEIWK